MNTQAVVTPMNTSAFVKALLASSVWFNLAGLPRYFLVVIPMMQAVYPGDSDVVPVTLPVFALWGVYTVAYMLASTGFYWMYFDRNGVSTRNIIVAGFWVALVTVAMTWLGIGNMGLAPYTLLFANGTDRMG